jgi:hypothetical protein
MRYDDNCPQECNRVVCFAKLKACNFVSAAVLADIEYLAAQGLSTIEDGVEGRIHGDNDALLVAE